MKWSSFATELAAAVGSSISVLVGDTPSAIVSPLYLPSGVAEIKEPNNTLPETGYRPA